VPHIRSQDTVDSALPRRQFVNLSTEIRQWCGEALDLVDVAWRQSNAKTISVSRRDDVARLDALNGAKR
jgi:hypothetical protein